MERRDATRPRLAGLLLGALLIVAGSGLLLAQLYGIDLRIDLAGIGWPLFVILPGVALLVVGLALDGESGIGLTVAGGIVTTVGLVLAYQSAYNHYASWAYAWALVAPGAVGASMALWGAVHLRATVLKTGLGALAAGLVMFLVFFAFFEGILNIGAQRGLAPLGRQALPFALIVAGVLVIVARLWPRGRPQPMVPPVPEPPVAQAMAPESPEAAESAAGESWASAPTGPAGLDEPAQPADDRREA